MEPQQLSYGHDPSTGRSRGYPGAHPLQRNVLPHLGGSVLGEGQWLRGVHEVQEADPRSEVWTQPDPQQKVHTLVVAHHQQG